MSKAEPARWRARGHVEVEQARMQRRDDRRAATADTARTADVKGIGPGRVGRDEVCGGAATAADQSSDACGVKRGGRRRGHGVDVKNAPHAWYPTSDSVSADAWSRRRERPTGAAERQGSPGPREPAGRSI